MKILNYKQFEAISDIDPYGEEIWEEGIQGFYVNKIDEIAKYGENKGNRIIYYLGLYRDVPTGSIYHLGIGDIFINGCTFKTFLLDNEMGSLLKPLDENEKDMIYNDDLKITCWHTSVHNRVPSGELEEYTLSEILKIFKINKDEINL